MDLEGVINFRDFGGMPGAGGRDVRTGRLFRSGHFATASDADIAHLAGLDFALFVDLRRPPERLRDPARRPPAPAARLLEHQGPTATAVAPHLAFLSQPDASPDKVTEQMIVGYRYYPFDPHYVAVYRDYFPLLATVDGPVLVNCHAGKDRTGYLCALTLHVLGVSRDDIFEDYLATNRYNRADARMKEMAEGFEGTHGHAPSEALLRRMMEVDAVYLEAAFDAIAQQHGDIDTYLVEVVGVDGAVRERIRERLLV
jgi:protein tyrosine/serine phosphatase